MSFQPDIDIRSVGISSSHNIKNTAFCRNDAEHTIVIGNQTGQRFTGTIICDNAAVQCVIDGIVPKLRAALLSKYMFLNAELSVVVIE